MAGVIVNAVLGKLTKFTFDKAVEKFQSLYRIEKEVESLKWELNYIHAFIKDADEKHIVDETQRQWVKDVMDVAYQIEDAVDIFLLECPGTPLEEGLVEPPSTIWGRLKGIAEKTTQIPFLSNFEAEIKEIRHRISEIKDYKNNFINTLGEHVGGQNKKRKTDPVHKLDPIGNPEIVGFKRDADNIVKCLIDEKNRSDAVVSIVGPGGLGKTTLAHKIRNRNDIKKHFDCSIWITISQKFNLVGILRKITQKLNINSTHLDENELATQVWMSLKGMRYLIIFDDVWTEELWNDISKVLPNTKKGSRVLITTRFQNIALAADTSYVPYKLSHLDNDESLELFLKKAVPKNHEYPCPSDELCSLAKGFALKCKGLPLALVVLGSLLSTRPYNFHVWKELLETMSWQVDGSKCIDTIATSYEYLPLAKKLCFLYFAAFPEDHEIEAEVLLRMWVAERLIPHEGTRTLEETAECFLEDLVQRNMVQVSERFSYGSIKYCRVHDIVRDLTVQKANEMNFLMVCSKPNDWRRCSKARRVAIHYSSVDNEELLGDYASPNVRSLLFFGHSLSRELLDFSKYRVLRLLCTMNDNVQLKSFKGSPHLRYIQLGTRGIVGKVCEFGEWVRGMMYLETLDLRQSQHGDLSNWIWQVKTLRHVLLYGTYFVDLTCGNGLFVVQVPPAAADLRNLQTLKHVIWKESWKTSGFPNISKVRVLAIEIDRKINAWEVASLVGRLKHVIVDLFVKGVIDLQKISTGGCPFSENLKSLELCNSHNILPLALCDGMLPPHLTKLLLAGYKFELDPMPVLEKLRFLKDLSLRGKYKAKGNEVTSIRCSSGGFKQLELLELAYIYSEEWQVEMGAMPMLKKLHVWNCDLLHVPPGLTHLHNLRMIEWDNVIQTNKDAISNLLQQRPDMKSSIPRAFQVTGTSERM